MSKHLEEVTVIALRNTSITLPSPEVVRIGQIMRMPRWCAEVLIEAGDFREYGEKASAGPSENKAVLEYKVNKDAMELAIEYDIDLGLVEGTGRKGRITVEDVQRVVDSL